MKFLKIIGLTLGILIIAVAGLLAYVTTALPKVKPADETLKIEATPARLARGEYLAKHVAACLECHSQQDWQTFGHPIIPGTLGKGGDPIFNRAIGLPGTIYPKNLTPYGLKRYSDGELVRVIRTGVTKEGKALFPFMPYQSFAQMEQEDLYSIIVYLRSLPEIKNDVPEHQLDAPLNIIVHTIPKDAPDFPKPVDRKDKVAYGKYLVTMAGCEHCHTPVDDHHQPLPGMFLAGGQEFGYPNSKYEKHPGGGVLRIPNITPDPETGIGRWTKAQFMGKFLEWRGKNAEKMHHPVSLDKGDYQVIMPLESFAGMTDEDLGDIYEYLRTIPAVKHPVVRFEPPKI
jgi:mono/diheme cytochrome c family protein